MIESLNYAINDLKYILMKTKNYQMLKTLAQSQMQAYKLEIWRLWLLRVAYKRRIS